MAAESARSLAARDESAELTAEQEEAEYETFTRMETERILREEVCAVVAPALRRSGMPNLTASTHSLPPSL